MPGGRVRFAEEGGEGSAAPDPAPAPTSATEVAVRMGILSCGGIYTTPILSDLSGASPPVVRGLEVSNLSTECRRQPGATASVLLLRFWADRPGPFDTTFTICLPDAHQEITVHVTATVMPRNKGTPGLKPAVHCVGFTAETDTEAASDWQGFD